MRVHPNVLKSTGTCKPEGELAILKSAAPGHLKVRTRYIEGEPSWEGLMATETPFRGHRTEVAGIIAR
jgi:hypothetical protein